MDTRILTCDPRQPEPEVLQAAAAVIERGGLVAFPTETVYGLGANALSSTAVGAIFQAKGRPESNPVIVHVASRDDVGRLVRSVPAAAELLMEKFWPGPLTLALPRSAVIPDAVTAGRNTVGIRMPHHPVALGLIQMANVPIAAPSANLSGRPSPTTAAHVADDLLGRIDLIIDAGGTGLGLESTVLDVSVDPPVLLRPGGVTLNEICSVIGPVQVHPSVFGAAATGEDSEPAPAPGTNFNHYQPNAPVVLVDGPLLWVQNKIQDLAYEFSADGRRVGVLCTAESRGVYSAPVVLELGTRRRLGLVAAALFGALRAFDRHGVDVILAEGFPEEGIGLALMNRLKKAAGGKVIRP